MTFGKLTTTSYVPDLNKIFILCFSNSTSNTLNNPNKTLPWLQQNKIKYPRYVNANSRNTVSRGVCKVDDQQNLISIKECTKIYKDSSGKVVYEENGALSEVPGDSSVSMNFWCFHPSAFGPTQKLFESFVAQNSSNIKSEFFIPIIADDFITGENNQIKVIPTTSKWFGVTYKEDAPGVKESIDRLVNEKVYPPSLWG